METSADIVPGSDVGQLREDLTPDRPEARGQTEEERLEMPLPHRCTDDLSGHPLQHCGACLPLHRSGHLAACRAGASAEAATSTSRQSIGATPCS